MKTQRFNSQQLDRAAQLLREGELVAFPTETVFGLGALCNNEEAVAKVFQAKGRPSDNPLIVHVATQDQVKALVESISPLAQRLMDHFWPGPLTIIFPVKPSAVTSNARGGKGTVGIRMPDQAMALDLIRLTGVPLVGPSANLSGKPSPTHIDHVLHDFDGKIAGVLDPGQDLTQVGVESTVVYPQHNRLAILRPGMITASDLALQMGCPVQHISEANQLANDHLASPGVKYVHYSPKQPVHLVTPTREDYQWMELLDQASGKIGLLVDDELMAKLSDHPKVVAVYSLGLKGDWASATRHLFSGLRSLENSCCDEIYVQGLENNEKTTAYNNRVSKASSFVI